METVGKSESGSWPEVSPATSRFVLLEKLRQLIRWSSTRRFCVRPSSVAFDATGFAGP
jgi:hypothetical protein